MTRHSILATIYSLTIGVFGVFALVALTDWGKWPAYLPTLAFFVALSVILKRAAERELFLSTAKS